MRFWVSSFARVLAISFVVLAGTMALGNILLGGFELNTSQTLSDVRLAYLTSRDTLLYPISGKLNGFFLDLIAIYLLMAVAVFVAHRQRLRSLYIYATCVSLVDLRHYGERLNDLQKWKRNLQFRRDRHPRFWPFSDAKVNLASAKILLYAVWVSLRWPGTWLMDWRRPYQEWKRGISSIAERRNLASMSQEYDLHDKRRQQWIAKYMVRHWYLNLIASYLPILILITWCVASIASIVLSSVVRQATGF